MWKLFGKAGAIAAAAATTLMVATPAEARRYHDDDDAALAIGAGVVGLAIGAAIASDRHDHYYYDGGYYRGYPRGYYHYPRYRNYYYRDYPRYRHHNRYYRDHHWRRYDRRSWRGDRHYRGRYRY